MSPVYLQHCPPAAAVHRWRNIAGNVNLPRGCRDRGIPPGHGEMAVHAVNVPVAVAGMDVAPGEIIHMDENGACKFPANKMQAVLDNVRALRDHEEKQMEQMREAKNATQLRAIFGGHAYGAEDEEK